jgi:hypothetical protein
MKLPINFWYLKIIDYLLRPVTIYTIYLKIEKLSSIFRVQTFLWFLRDSQKSRICAPKQH